MIIINYKHLEKNLAFSLIISLDPIYSLDLLHSIQGKE